MKTLNFTDRLTYLAWRKEWKTCYAQLSIDIRAKKNEYKGCQRKVVFSLVNSGKPWEHIAPFYDDKPLSYTSGYFVAFNAWQKDRREANNMLMLLDKAKEKSCLQRNAEFSKKQETSITA